MKQLSVLPASAFIVALAQICVCNASGGLVAYHAVSLDFNFPVEIARYTSARGVWNGAAVGVAAETGPRTFLPDAILWPGASPAHVVLAPSSRSPFAVARGIEQDNIVGYAGGSFEESFGFATMWAGPQHTLVDLHPAAYANSAAYGVWGNEQVGLGITNDLDPQQHALLWHGSAGSVVDLGGTVANAVYNGHQVGVADNHAALWSGTAASRIDLNPTGYDSSAAIGIFGDKVVGYGETHDAFVFHQNALLWNTATNQLVNLNPGTFTDSQATGIFADSIVGFGTSGGGTLHALLWTGPDPSDVIDLHNFLPPGTGQSQAFGVDARGNIVGEADGRAIMWVPGTAVPLPPAIFGGATLLAMLGVAHLAARRCLS